MTAQSYAVFETAIGTCAIAWGSGGILAVQLPEADAAASRARLERRFPKAKEAPAPAEIQGAIDGVIALLRGEASDFTGLRLDMDGAPAFQRRVWEAARDIPPGETRSYGEIAARLGDAALARDVGQAMGRNPFPIIVPCHRVLAAGGKIGGFSAHGGITTKRRLLAIESALARREPDLFSREPLAR
jgi:methylated-DNA-[protein]-cysteine S-methyltransferase